MNSSSKSKVIAFVPARCGSKSIPLKNIKLFNGKPLISWVLHALNGCNMIDEIIVSTDCQEIETCVKKLNYNKVQIYHRSASSATDTASTESAMIDYLSKADLYDKDIFILVQATSPWTQTEDFNKALKQYKHSAVDSLLSVVKNHSFYWNKEGKSINYDFSKRPRRQEFDFQYQENGAFYINNVGNILKHNNRLSGKIALYEMSKYSSIELDDMEDWTIAETLMPIFLKQNNTK